jgi:hypothetical protein
MNKRPTDILEDEHRVILKVVGTMPVLAESLETGASVAPDVLRGIAEFMRPSTVVRRTRLSSARPGRTSTAARGLLGKEWG